MPVVDMACVLDVSGSFEDEHQDGTTNDLITRLAPWGLSFHPDRKIAGRFPSPGRRGLLLPGVAKGGGRFEFLEAIGDAFGNTGFKAIADVRRFIGKTDEQINAFMLDDELVAWLKA